MLDGRVFPSQGGQEGSMNRLTVDFIITDARWESEPSQGGQEGASSQGDHFKFASTSNLCIRNTHHQTNLLKSKKARDMLLFQFQKSNAAIRAMRELKKEF